MQVPFVETTRSQLAVTFVTALTLLRMQRRRLHCESPDGIYDRLITLMATFRWFPEGVIQYNDVKEEWIFE